MSPSEFEISSRAIFAVDTVYSIITGLVLGTEAGCREAGQKQISAHTCQGQHRHWAVPFKQLKSNQAPSYRDEENSDTVFLRNTLFDIWNSNMPGFPVLHSLYQSLFWRCTPNLNTSGSHWGCEKANLWEASLELLMHVTILTNSQVMMTLLLQNQTIRAKEKQYKIIYIYSCAGSRFWEQLS